MKKFLLGLCLAGLTLAGLQLQSCKKDEAEDPRIETISVTALSPTKAIFKGNVAAKGTPKIIDFGFLYGTSGNIDESTATKVSLGANVPNGEYSKEVTNINLNNNYGYTTQLYARAYLKNEKGTAYGKVITVQMPAISASNVSPQSGKAGDLITISGQFYSTPADQILVSFNNTAAKVTEASDTKIVVQVPALTGVSHGTQIPIQITIGGQKVNTSYYFTMLATVKDFSPKNGAIGTTITFSGDNLPVSYYNYGTIKVLFGETEGIINNYSTGIQATVPYNVTSEKLKVTVIMNGQSTVLPGELTVKAPTVTSISPSSGIAGTAISIEGTDFPVNYMYYPGVSMFMGNTAMSVNGISSTSISGVVPNTLSPGDYTFTIKGGPHTVSSTQKFKVIAPSISSFSPSTGGTGKEINITGTFIAGQWYNVYFGSVAVNSYATSSTNLRTYVPYYTTDPGAVKLGVEINGQVLEAKGNFTYVPPKITSFTPASGVAGTIVTIYGSGFNASYSEVRFGSTQAYVQSASADMIRCTVPSNLTPGAMKITVGGGNQLIESSDSFTVKN